MNSELKLDESVARLLCCPICKSKLELAAEGQFGCMNPACSTVFPIVDGVPILINEANSVFSIQDFVQERDTYFVSDDDQGKPPSALVSRVRAVMHKMLPEIDRNVRVGKNYPKFADLLTRDNPNPRALVIGGSIVGEGLETVLHHPSIRFVESDISFGPRTALICDAHDIPFDDGAFDGIVVQAVLEHVIDPYRCVDEIYRVLKGSGLVYAETAFMQQVHGGGYDFTRFTYLGHRRLFRRFEEIDSGAACGPGSALAWSYKYFLQSFARSRFGMAFARYFAHFTVFWLKYFDHYLADRPHTLDAASGYYFLGRKSNRVIKDRDLVLLYRNRESTEESV